MSPNPGSVHDDAGNTPAPHAADRKSMVKIAPASLVGTVIEFYDFLIYATAAALVFAHVFFPGLGQAAGTAASFATLGSATVFGLLLAFLCCVSVICVYVVPETSRRDLADINAAVAAPA